MSELAVVHWNDLYRSKFNVETVILSRPSIVLTYHEICDPALHSYTVSPTQFEEHVRIARELSQPPVFTFDDGHASAVRAAEILSKYGITATFFVTAGWLGAKPGYLSERDLQTIVS